MTKTVKGFTLIELLIAVAVASLLAAVAYPSYMDSVRKSGRGDARAELNNVANALERFFAANRTYTTDMAALGFDDSLSAAGKYSVTIEAGNSGAIATSYRIVATPVTGKSQEHDDTCPSFTLDSAGSRLPNPATSDCW